MILIKPTNGEQTRHPSGPVHNSSPSVRYLNDHVITYSRIKLLQWFDVVQLQERETVELVNLSFLKVHIV